MVAQESAAIDETGARMRVDPDKLLQAAKIVATQADKLSEVLARTGPTLRVDAPSPNEISSALAECWNDAMVDGDESYLARVQEYVRGLRSLERQLLKAAQRYELDDEETAEAFNTRDVVEA